MCTTNTHMVFGKGTEKARARRVSPPYLLRCNTICSSTMDTNAVQAAQTTMVAISTLVQGIAGGVIKVGEKTPRVAPVCVALLAAKEYVDGAGENKKELGELEERCTMITVRVNNEFQGSQTPTIDVEPLVNCVEELTQVAKRYNDQGSCWQMVQFRRHGHDIRRLGKKIETTVRTMGLARIFNTQERLERIQNMVVRSQQ